jgi:rod shape determining protein RodA
MRFFSFLLIIVAFGAVSLTMLSSIYPTGVTVQAFAFLLGIIAFFVTAYTPFAFWKQSVSAIMIIITCLLLFTLILGKTTKGSTRWLSIGPVQFQPSQLAKPIVSLYLCSYLMLQSKRKKEKVRFAFKQSKPSFSGKFLQKIKPYSPVAASILLVFLQPDLGTALILLASAGFAIYFSGVSLRVLLSIVGATACVAVLSWFVLLRDYQKQRIVTFLSPTQDMLGAGYHATQSVVTVGSGQLLGRGLGHGVQTDLRFLPERQTDFFFASLAEELGFVGSMLVFLLYFMLFFLCFRFAGEIQDTIGKAFAFSLAGSLAVQTTMNLGMNLGLLPIAGVTLPLLSLGGSSVISILFGLGIMASALQANTTRRLVEIHSFV